MKTNLGRKRYLVAFLSVLLAACSDSEDTPSDAGAEPDSAPVADAAGSCGDEELAALEAAMAATLDSAAAENGDPDFTLLLEASDGRRFVHSHGASTADTVYESASTSKLVAAVVIVDLVDEGLLTLGSKAHDLIPFWTETAVTLRDLLSFTSGFSDEPLCINLPNADFAGCVETIFDDNVDTAAAPGTEFFYASTHLQIAGLMAIRASGAESWTEVFDAFKAKTGLFPTSAFDLPSATNPRLAGGMHWTAAEYIELLRGLYFGEVLEDATRAQLFANQRGGATVAYSPTVQGAGEDWAYGLGNWLECPTATEPNSYSCGPGTRNSSPGAFGAYPFIDFDDHYFGILAIQEGIGGREGLVLFRTIEDTARTWASRSCQP